MNRNLKWLFLLFALLLSPLFGREAQAQTINAASCSSADVSTALNSINTDGTTVVIPSCSATNWTSSVNYTQTNSFTLQGQSTTSGTCGPGGTCTATDNTILVDAITRVAGCGGADPGMLVINSISGKTLRVTGITFNFTGNQTCTGTLVVDGTSASVRVDHNHFNLQCGAGMGWHGWTFGVVDHNRFDDNTACTWNGIKFGYESWNNDAFGNGDQSWAAATNFGTSNFMFVENNGFFASVAGTPSYADDCGQGGRFVWRYNLMVNTELQTHPTGGGAEHRGCRATEIYNNVDTGTGGAGGNFNGYFLSSGPSLIWGNSWDSTFSNAITIHSMRRDNSTYSQAATPVGWGYCGTTFSGIGSNWDKNSNSSTGYRCLDQPGQGQGQLITGNFPSKVINTTGIIAWPNDALEPVYEWSDTFTGTTFLNNYQTDALFNNSDYYLYCAPSSPTGCTSAFNGTVGTGSGLLSARPSTCTTGVAYWGTDTSTLYKCTNTNTWTSYYTPYTYPHPLASGSISSGPSAPSNLTAVVN